MPNVRVYQLAKELEVQSALILELLDRMGQEVKSDLSVLDPNTANLVRSRVTSALDAEKKRLADEHRVVEHQEPTASSEPAASAPEEVGEPAAADAPAAPIAAQPAAARPATAPAAAKPAATPRRPAPAATPTVAPADRKPRVFAAQRIPTPGMLKPRPKPGPTTGAGPYQRPKPVGPAATGAGPFQRPNRPGGRPGGMAGRPGMPPGGKRRRKNKNKAPVEAAPVPSRPKPDLPPVPETITLSEGVTVKELAEKLNRKSKDVITKLIPRGVLATINQPLEPDMAIEVAKEFGSTATIMSFEEEAQLGGESADTPKIEPELDEARIERPPVVTVMGHVDHGKTSLLDAMRTTDVAGGEAGGITQHIGAYQVEEKGRKITFLDTPGHEAFTLMRARGARVTDIVVLVVAADDGVKPQTLEAIDHAKAANVPIVVAINKIDKPGSNPGRVKQQLADRDLLVEEYGGTAVACEVSAKKKTGLDHMLEMILLVADMREIKANPAKPAAGVVLEARRDRSRGVLATVLVQEGTLHVGDAFISGTAHGKVRAMTDEHGTRVTEIGPSTPCEVMGFSGEPGAGEVFQAVANESKARQIVGFRQDKLRAEKARQSSARTLENFADSDNKELSILLKTDVQGSVEAIQKALSDLPSDKIRVRILRSSIGAISQADVLLAAASNLVVIGFNVRPDKKAAELAKQESVELRMYTVIYDLVDDVRQSMVGMLEPTFKERVLGQAEVRQTFKVPKVGFICGSYVTDGKVTRNAQIRLLRDNVVIHTGKVGSLRRFKDDAAEVKQGYECGIGIADYNDVKEGDVIEFFVMDTIVAKSL